MWTRRNQGAMEGCAGRCRFIHCCDFLGAAALKIERTFGKEPRHRGRSVARCSEQWRGVVRMGRGWGPLGLGSGGGCCRGQPRWRPGAQRCRTHRSFRHSRPRHWAGSQPLPQPVSCDSSSSRELGALGSDCPSPQALQRAHRVAAAGAIGEGLSFSKGAAGEGKGLSILSRSQGGGRRPGWGPRGSRSWKAPRVPESSLGVSGSRGP